jgi:ATP-dependent Clp protease ATP-binding subunit ClpC
VKNRSLPGTAVDVIDEAGAAAQLHQGSLPEEVVEIQKRIRFIVQRLESSILNHEFEKARFYSQEERKERDALKQLCEKYKLNNNPAFSVGREQIERAIGKVFGNADNSDSTSS